MKIYRENTVSIWSVYSYPGVHPKEYGLHEGLVTHRIGSILYVLMKKEGS